MDSSSNEMTASISLYPDICSVLLILRNTTSDIDILAKHLTNRRSEDKKETESGENKKEMETESANTTLASLQSSILSAISKLEQFLKQEEVRKKKDEEEQSCHIRVTPKVEYLSEYLDDEEIDKTKIPVGDQQDQLESKPLNEIKVEFDTDPLNGRFTENAGFVSSAASEDLVLTSSTCPGVPPVKQECRSDVSDADEDLFSSEMYGGCTDLSDSRYEAAAFNGKEIKIENNGVKPAMTEKLSAAVNKQLKKKRKLSGGAAVKVKKQLGSSKNRCLLCLQQFDQDTGVMEHVRLKHGEGPFSCKDCSQSYSSYLDLFVCHSRHKKKTDTKKQVPTAVCEICKMVVKKGSLVRHMKYHEPAEEECQICNKKFVDKNLLKRHIKIKHDQIFPFHCDICGKGSESRNNLAAHVRTHTGEKFNTCDKCGKTFNQRAHMLRHIRIVHEGIKEVRKQKKLICGKCGKVFTGTQSLKRHVKVVHEGQREFACEICHRLFSDKWKVKQHMPVHKDHSEVKLHQCEICDKSFTHIRSLKGHMVKHHN